MGLKGSKVVTVPQMTPLWRLLGRLRGTQGSWKLSGIGVGIRWLLRSRRGLEQGRGGFPRLGRRLRESVRSGGGGGRFDLRREILRVQRWMQEEEEVQEEAQEEDLNISSMCSEAEEAVSSENKEVRSV